MSARKKAFRPRTNAEKAIETFLSGTEKTLVIDVRGEKLPRNVAALSERVDSLLIDAPRARSLRELGDIKGLRNLTIFAPMLEDADFMEELNDLTSLAIYDSKKISDLDYDYLPVLEELALPGCSSVVDLSTIEECKRLKVLDISGTGVSNINQIKQLYQIEEFMGEGAPITSIAALSELHSLRKLSLSGSAIKNISALKGLEKLVELNISHTAVKDISAIGSLKKLETLSISGTRVDNISHLSNLKSLKKLYAANMGVVDISSIRNAENLEYLIIKGSVIADLSPVTNLLSLCDAATKGVDLDLLPVGFEYGETFATNIVPILRNLSHLSQPFRTVEAVNLLCRQIGKSEYWPLGYSRPENIEAILIGDVQTEDGTASEIHQRPATFSFRFVKGRIEAEPSKGNVADEDIASDLYSIIKEKVGVAIERFEGAQQERIMFDALREISDCLGSTLSDVRPGVLLMRFRSIEALRSSFDTPEGRRELSEASLTVLLDLCTSIEDLMGLFPSISRIQSERLALSVQEVDLPALTANMRHIVDDARNSSVVGPSALQALDLGSEILEKNNEIINSNFSTHNEIVAARETQSKNRKSKTP